MLAGDTYPARFVRESARSPCWFAGRPGQRCASPRRRARTCQYHDPTPTSIGSAPATTTPTTAQFLTRDPLESTTGQPYSYAANDPLNADDPAGLLPSLTSVLNKVNDLNPMAPMVNGFITEYVAYESGCGFGDSVKIGLRGTLETVGLLAMFPAPEARAGSFALNSDGWLATRLAMRDERGAIGFTGRGSTEAGNRSALNSGKVYESETAARRAAEQYAGKHPNSCTFRGLCGSADHFHVDKTIN